MFLHLSDGDGQDEPWRGAVGVAVKVPLAVHLPGQSLVGHVPDEPLGHSQAHLVPEAAAFQLPAALQDGPPEAVGAFAAHLGQEESDDQGLGEEKIKCHQVRLIRWEAAGA